MRTPPKKLLRVIEKAVELRASGQSWTQIARKVRRRPESVRSWSKRYREYWQRLLAEARREIMAEASDEGLIVLRNLLRSEDERIKRDASSRLVNLQPPTKVEETPTVLLQFVQFLEELSDDDLDALLGESDAADGAGPQGSETDAGDPASAA